MISLRIAETDLNITTGTNLTLPLVNDIQSSITDLNFSFYNAFSPNLCSVSPFGTAVYDGFTLELQAYTFTNEGYMAFDGNFQHADLGNIYVLWYSLYNEDITSFVTVGLDTVVNVAVSFSEFSTPENSGNQTGTTTLINYITIPNTTTIQTLSNACEIGSALGPVVYEWAGNAADDCVINIITKTGYFQVGQVTVDITGAPLTSFNGIRYYAINRNNAGNSPYKIIDYLPTNIGDPEDFNIDDFSLSVLTDDALFQAAFSTNSVFLKDNKPCVLIGYDGSNSIVPFILEFSEDFSTYTKYNINPNDAQTTTFINEYLLNNLFITAAYSKFDNRFYLTGGSGLASTFYAMSDAFIPPTPTISTYRSRMPIKLECGNYCIPLMKR